MTAVGTALERTLSVQLMHGVSKPAFTTLKAGDTLVRQGQMCSDLYLVLDGVIRVDRDGAQLAEYGPGAILGERAEDFEPAETLGHAAAEYAIGLAGAAGARRVLLLHHRPDRTDSELGKLAAGLRDSPVPVALAADGEVICR